MRISQIYLTATLAAAPVAVAAIFAATPTAAPAQLSLDAAGQSAVLVQVAPPLAPCRWPGGDSPQSACPGSNKTNTTRNSDQRTGSDGSLGGGTGRFAPPPGGANLSPGIANASPGKPNASMGDTDTSDNNGCGSACS